MCKIFLYHILIMLNVENKKKALFSNVVTVTDSPFLLNVQILSLDVVFVYQIHKTLLPELWRPSYSWLCPFYRIPVHTPKHEV